MRLFIVKLCFVTLTVFITLLATGQSQQNLNDMEIKTPTTTVDHSDKSILARGCDPVLSKEFARVVPPLVGNAQYVPTTDDNDFIEQLKSKKWSVIYFAPGACRFSAAKQQIPGGIGATTGWTLEDYKALIYDLQGEDIQIVESIYEEGSIEMLNDALSKAQ